MTNHQYYAQINEANIVTDVAVVHKDFLEANPDRYPGTWVETFIDVEGKTYAGIGYTYNTLTQDFTAPPVPELPFEE
jgi:hypothetical protein